MNRPEIYKKSIDILSRAYLEGTLAHDDCNACAVGNLVAAACGSKVVIKPLGFGWDKGFQSWSSVHVIRPISNYQVSGNPATQGYIEGIQQIRKTGYTHIETAAIERAFEFADEGESEDDWMYNGLMAVVECLDRIHEVNDEEITTASKARFVKELANN